MALESNNISVTKVNQALGTNINNLGRLCLSSSINKYSLWKPVSFNKLTGITESELLSINDGFEFTVYNTLDSLKTAITNGTVWNYIRPQGGSSSPYRLGDFRFYDHSATQWITYTNSNVRVNQIRVVINNNVRDQLKKLPYWFPLLPEGLRGEQFLSLFLSSKTGNANKIVGLKDVVDIASGDTSLLIILLDMVGSIPSGSYNVALGLYPSGDIGQIRDINPMLFNPISDSWNTTEVMTAEDIVKDIFSKLTFTLVNSNVTKLSEGSGQFTYELNDMTITITNNNDEDVTLVVDGSISVLSQTQRQRSDNVNVRINKGQTVTTKFTFSGVSLFASNSAYSASTIFSLMDIDGRSVTVTG